MTNFGEGGCFHFTKNKNRNKKTHPLTQAYLRPSGFITVMIVLLLVATGSLGTDGGYVEIVNVRSQFNCGGNMW